MSEAPYANSPINYFRSDLFLAVSIFQFIQCITTLEIETTLAGWIHHGQ